MNSINYHISNSLSELDKISEIIEKVLGQFSIDSQYEFNLRLCLDEILTNTITYGYPDGKHGEIEMEFRFDSPILYLKISDDAVEFNPLTVAEPDLNSVIEERKIGGLGIYFVRKLTKSQHYERKSGKNVLSLEFSVV